jgi:hypothetical protein
MVEPTADFLTEVQNTTITHAFNTFNQAEFDRYMAACGNQYAKSLGATV